MQLNILYEDTDMLVCFKPAGIATQTASLSDQDMVSLINNYLAKQEKGRVPYVGVIHRLDQPVSGLLVFAKNQKVAASLSRQIQDGNANKDYIALCFGTLEKKTGMWTHYIMKDPVTKQAKVMGKEQIFKCNEYSKERNSQICGTERKQFAKKSGNSKESEVLSYKKAILCYEVEKEFEDSSIVKVHLQTGRFHQIRAQFSFVGNALLGDTKYGTTGSRELSMKKGINKIALCAYRLTLKHPTTGKEMEFLLDRKHLPKWYLSSTS